MLKRLAPEEKQAGAAALGLVVALFLPWYGKNVAQGGAIVSGNLNAFSVVSFVEAAIMLVAAGVLGLLYARARERPFHLPGGDGTVIMAAGAWAAFLLVWRLFDKPDVEGAGATVGIQWGWFVAVVMAGLLAAAGARLRAANRPEPPNPAAELDWEQPVRAPRERTRPADHGAVTEVLRDRPSWEGDPPPEAPDAGPAGSRRAVPSEAPAPDAERPGSTGSRRAVPPTERRPRPAESREDAPRDDRLF